MPTTRQVRKNLPDAVVLRELFAYDAGSGLLVWAQVTPRRAKRAAGHVTPGGYRRVILGDDDDRFMVHRVIWKLVTGQEPPEFIDHIDGNRLNNAWANLRAADAVTNARNVSVHKRNKLGVKGVSVCSTTGKFAAYIRENGKNRLLGRYSSVQDAARSYSVAASETFGVFARTTGSL